MTTQTIVLRVDCHFDPLPYVGGVPAAFGMIRKQHGLVPGELIGNAICFTAPVTANVADETKTVRFTGPYVNGSGNERFLYLGLRRIDRDEWARRWKVSLAEISFETVSSLGASQHLHLVIDAPAFDKVWIRSLEWTPLPSQ